jgi:hypothetical protein
MSQIDPSKQEVFDYCKTMLGDGMIDVELDPKHYETALNRALAVYRQRSDNAVEESYAFLQLKADQQEYILPKEIQQVRQLFRRSIGSRSGGGNGGTVFEPFNLAYTNTYLLSSTNMGGLLTYELFAQYQELVIQQRPRADEEILLWIYNVRPDSSLIADTYAGQWIKDYSLANCKIMLGQARELFGQIAGPQGGTSLNGAAMKAEGQADIDRLTIDLTTSASGGIGYSWIVG